MRFLRPLALALVLFLIVRALLFEAFKIPTSSMEPTLLPGDFVLVNKAIYGSKISPGLGVPGWEDPKRGDIIVFQPPHDPNRNYVKRVVGQPGDTVAMIDRIIFVNGEILGENYLETATGQEKVIDVRHSDMEWQEEYSIHTDQVTMESSETEYRPSRDNWGPLSVPSENFFVLGDNRNDSEDSRYWGFVKRGSIDGKAWLIYYSSELDYDSLKQWYQALRWERIGRRID